MEYLQLGMILSAKTFRTVLIGLAVIVLVSAGISIIPLKRFTEFSHAEVVKGHWASLQEFVNKNGRYPKDEVEIGAFFNETPEELKQEPVEYIAPHNTNADEVILWCKQKTVFGVRVGITESGVIVKR